jgi:hypothetical protein
MNNSTKIAAELIRQANNSSFDKSVTQKLAKLVCVLDRKASYKFEEWIVHNDEWNSKLNQSSAR